jgi:hypothetical protein
MIDTLSDTITTDGAALEQKAHIPTSIYHEMRNAAGSTYLSNTMSIPASNMITNLSNQLTAGTALRDDPSKPTSTFNKFRTAAALTYGAWTMAGPGTLMMAMVRTETDSTGLSLRIGADKATSHWYKYRIAAISAYPTTTMSTPGSMMVVAAKNKIESESIALTTTAANITSAYFKHRDVAKNVFETTTMSTPGSEMVNKAGTSIRTYSPTFGVVMGTFRTQASNTFLSTTMLRGGSEMIFTLGNEMGKTGYNTYGSTLINSMGTLGSKSIAAMEEQFSETNSRSISKKAVDIATNAWRRVRTVFGSHIEALPVPGTRVPPPGSGGWNPTYTQPLGPISLTSIGPSGAATPTNTGAVVINNNTTINFTPTYNRSNVSPASDVALARIMSKV